MFANLMTFKRKYKKIELTRNIEKRKKSNQFNKQKE